MCELNQAPDFMQMAEEECKFHLTETINNINKFENRIEQILFDIKQIRTHLKDCNDEKAYDIITSGELLMALSGFDTIVNDLKRSVSCAAATDYILFRAKQALSLKS